MRRWLRQGLLVAAASVLMVALANAAAAAPPADAFCVILIEPSADFSMIRFYVDEETSIEERAALWPSVDLDENGIVSPVEKEAFRWAQTRMHANQSELGLKAIVLQPDAPYTKSSVQRPVYATTWRQVGHVFHKQDYQLPEKLTQASELETQEVREFGFELEEGRSSRFILVGGQNLTAYGNITTSPSHTDLPKPVIEYVVVRAPKDWVVQRIEGFSYNGSFVGEPGEAEVDVPAFDTKRPYSITFLNPALDEKLGEISGSPGIEALAILGLVAGAAWATRIRNKGT